MSLVDKGNSRIEWASREMPVLSFIKKDFEERKPF